MTYGRNAGALRDELTALLRHHRIQQRLGGPGNPWVPESTTVAEREEMGRVIRRYRYATLTWCREALEAVSPKIDLPRESSIGHGPVEELRYRLGRTLSVEVTDPPLLDLLGIAHEFDLLVRWQSIARAAALGEHDFTADVNFGRLTEGQGRTVVKDAAGVIRGLVVLDRRYESLPGWKHLCESARLGRAADTVSHLTPDGTHDLSVDARGWRPAPAAITGPALPGVAGAVQAQHNMLVDLVRFPHALNLRRLFQAQAQVSHEAARQAASAAPELVERFVEREQVYKTLVAQSRDLGGMVGTGGLAVTESQNAVARLRHAPIAGTEQRESLHDLVRLFIRTDARLAATIEHGFHEKVYFVSARVPRITDELRNWDFQPRVRWAPVTSPVQTDLLPLIRDRLRPQPPCPTELEGARASRRAYEAAVAHPSDPRRWPTR